MEFILFRFFALLSVAFVGSHAALTFEDYWRSVLPNTPMPKSISELLQSPGIIARLPFGRNPYADPVPTPSAVAAEKPRPTPSVLMSQVPLLSSQVLDKQNKNARKRYEGDTSKNHSNKNKIVVTEDPSTESVESTFGSLATNTYTREDLKTWKGRNDEDAEFNFKLGLGDAFYHGLNVLAHKNAIIKDWDKALKKLRNEVATNQNKLYKAQRKLTDEVKARKHDINKLQSDMAKQSLEAKQASEASEKANARLRMEIENLKAGIKKRQSEGFNEGFLSYLRNFLAGDPDYEWSKHFAPSTHAYMLTFKSDNAELIEEAKADLAAKIKVELLAAAEDQQKKVEANAQGKGDPTGDNTQEAPPSNTMVS